MPLAFDRFIEIQQIFCTVPRVDHRLHTADPGYISSRESRVESTVQYITSWCTTEYKVPAGTGQPVVYR